jgi:plasmid stabilization system protein ParE
MNTYFLSSIAEQDIEDIVSYIAQENPNAAMRLLEGLFDAMNKLALNPMLGHKREDLTHHPVRFWTFKWHYLIVYKSCFPIEIVRVLSGYRDISSLLA